MNIFLKIYIRRFLIFFLIFTFSLTFFIKVFAAVWSEPSQDPPGGNIDPPINQGTTPQAKNGRLTIGSNTASTNDYLTVFGSSKLDSLNVSGNLSVSSFSNLATTTIMGLMGVGIKNTEAKIKVKIYDADDGPIISLQGRDDKYRGIKIVTSSSNDLERWFIGANGSNNFVIRITTSTLPSSAWDPLTIDGSGNIQLGKAGLKNCSTTQAITTDSSGNLNCGTISGSGGSSLWTELNSNIYRLSKVGVGTITPTSDLHVKMTSINVEGIRITSYGSSGYSPFAILGDDNTTDLFRVRQTGKVEIKGLSNCSSIKTDGNGILSCGSSAVYVGVTGSTYNGSNGGYTAANNLCSNTEGLSGSHVCTTNEMLNTIIANGTMPPNGSILWIFNGPPGYTVEANDCNGRTSISTSSYGAVWQMSSTNGRGMITKCDNANRFACCK